MVVKITSKQKGNDLEPTLTVICSGQLQKDIRKDMRKENIKKFGCIQLNLIEIRRKELYSNI